MVAKYVTCPACEGKKGAECAACNESGTVTETRARQITAKAQKSYRDGLRTCQCCARLIRSNQGHIAHHGYQRPGDGYQTASCSGAKEVPFEVGRDTLGRVIVVMRDRLARLQAARAAAEREEFPVTFYYRKHLGYGHTASHSVDITREDFDMVREAYRNQLSHGSFDELKARDLWARDRDIGHLVERIQYQQERYDSWQQTERWDGAVWVRV